MVSAPPAVPGGRVLQLSDRRVIEIVDRPVPEPGPGEVVVNVTALGLCGTDLHLFDGRGNEYPWVVGHDAAGVVATVGSEVSGLAEGQRVAVEPLLSCGQCPACERGKTQLCAVGGYLGMLGPGMAAQYVALPAVQVIPLPDSVSDLAATALEPLAVALHTLRRVAPLMSEPGPAIVIGGGPLGLLQAQVMEHFGWECSVVEPQARRRELGSSLGLTTLTPEEADALEDDGRTRLIVETSASGPGVDQSERVATPGSVIAVVGRGPHSVTPPAVLLKELSILGVKGGPGLYPASVDLVAQGVVDPTAVITDTFDWEQAQQAFTDTVEQPGTIVRSALNGDW